MKKNIYSIMKLETAEALNQCKLELLGLEVMENVDKETGEISTFVRADIEVAKGQGKFSRCQFSVKIPDCKKIKVTLEELEQAEFRAFFTNLTISFIDSRGTVYFKAEDYDVEKIEQIFDKQMFEAE